MEKLGQLFQIQISCLEKSPQNLSWLVHRSEICLIAASYLYGSILCIGDGTN